MNKRYRVVFLGLITSEDNFKDRMSRLGVPSATTEGIIKKAPVILKQDMPIGMARRYADAVQWAGGNVNIQEHGFFEQDLEKTSSLKIEPLESFTMCPQCGHKQIKTEHCVKCGSTISTNTDPLNNKNDRDC